MRTILCFLSLSFFPFCFFAQNNYNDYQYWDSRSDAWLTGRVGIGHQFSNQNWNLYFFAEADLCASCAVTYFVHRPGNEYDVLKYNRERANLHVRLQTNKDYRLYNTRFNRKNADPQFKNLSWTYITSVGISLEHRWKKTDKIANAETGQATDAFFGAWRTRLRYDLTSRFHSYYYRKLSNTVGYFTLSFTHLDDRFGFALNWGNDIFILGNLKRFITEHDHGETNSAYISAWFRPLQQQNQNPEEAVEYYPESLQRWYLTVSMRGITDRRTLNRFPSNQARYGMYDVIKLKNSFHEYVGIKGGVEGGFYRASLFLGMDDLLWGRDIQRWAHQGYQHIAPEQARKIWAYRVINNLKSESPLFPWEKSPGFYRPAKFYYELDTELGYPLLQGL